MDTLFNLILWILEDAYDKNFLFHPLKKITTSPQIPTLVVTFYLPKTRGREIMVVRRKSFFHSIYRERKKEKKSNTSPRFQLWFLPSPSEISGTQKKRKCFSFSREKKGPPDSKVVINSHPLKTRTCNHGGLKKFPSQSIPQTPSTWKMEGNGTTRS